MAAATNQDEVPEILRAVTMVKERLGVRTVLGVSNVSFGLPQRDVVNATFLAAALGAGCLLYTSLARRFALHPLRAGRQEVLARASSPHPGRAARRSFPCPASRVLGKRGLSFAL